MKWLSVLILSFVFCLGSNLYPGNVYSEEYKNPCGVENPNSDCAIVLTTLVEMVQYINTAKKQPGQKLDISGFDSENILNKNDYFCQERIYSHFVDVESVLGLFWTTSCGGWVKDITCIDENCTFTVTSDVQPPVK